MIMVKLVEEKRNVNIILIERCNNICTYLVSAHIILGDGNHYEHHHERHIPCLVVEFLNPKKGCF